MMSEGASTSVIALSFRFIIETITTVLTTNSTIYPLYDMLVRLRQSLDALGGDRC
jgi:hypothetical protein